MDTEQLTEHLSLTARDLTKQFTGEMPAHDYRTLVELGPGTLSLDLLTGECRHQGHHVPPLFIVGILGSWLQESLVTAGLPKTAATHARLDASLQLEPCSLPRSPADPPGPPIDSTRCRVSVKVRLVAQGIVAHASGDETLEWYNASAA